MFMTIFGEKNSIIDIHVDGIKIIRTPEEFPKGIKCLNNFFEMKDLEKTMSLLSGHLYNGLFVHHECHMLSTHMMLGHCVCKRFFKTKRRG